MFGVGLFFLQTWLYNAANMLSKIIGTVNHAFCPKIPIIDDRIPVVSVFVLIYLFSFLFWIGGPVAASATKKSHFVNYIVSLNVAYLIGTLILICFPSYMDRVQEGLIEIGERPGWLNGLLGLVYAMDGKETAFNLFPSFHCLNSVFCYLGVRKQPEISKGFQIYSLLMAVLICLSTVFTKQHYFMDVVGGVAIAFICYGIINRLNPGKKYE